MVRGGGGGPADGGVVKVSVVVALYNTGPHLLDLVASLDAQSMSSDEFEVILVDDGSTDGTLTTARELAAARTNLSVETIPNSGWPGRPRNVGLDLANGDYVFFSDHDDRFGTRALEVMYEMATANRADIVYGKIVRTGRSTPYWPVWRHDLARADIAELAILSRTVHKLYRRAFLIDHDIRFREGRVRLEDHEFMALALARADAVSVIASEPCYWWVHRNDGSNNSSNPVDPATYWGHYGHVLSTWRTAAGPGELLDSARVISAVQAFTRFAPKAYFARSSNSRRQLFDAVHAVFREHLPPALDHRLPVYKRLRAQALRDGDFERFEQLQEYRSEFTFRTETGSVGAQDGRLRVVVAAQCGPPAGDRSLPVEEKDGRSLLPLDPGVNASDVDRALLEDDRGSLEITIRHRESGVEWPVHTQVCRRGLGLAVTADALVDLSSTTFGDPLTPGIWDLLVRVQFLGESLIKRVAQPESGLATGPDAPPPGVYVTANGMLSFKVAGAVGSHRARVESVTWRGRNLVVEFAAGTTASVVYAKRRGETETDCVVPVETSRALVDVDALPGDGVIDLWLRDHSGTVARLAYEGRRVAASDGRSPLLAAYSTKHGSLSIMRTAVVQSTDQRKSRLRGLVRRRG